MYFSIQLLIWVTLYDTCANRAAQLTAAESALGTLLLPVRKAIKYFFLSCFSSTNYNTFLFVCFYICDQQLFPRAQLAENHCESW